MTETISLKCSCGQTCLDVTGSPIASVECCCTSCQVSGLKLQQLRGAPQVLTDYETTPFVMYRKDRVRFVSGVETLREIRMSPDAKTRRVVATCCNTPIFLEFLQGHWLSIYAGLWPDDARPPLDMRTMAGDLPTSVTLPDDVPNPKKHSLGFYAKLMGAWIAMGFRVPAVPKTPPLD